MDTLNGFHLQEGRYCVGALSNKSAWKVAYSRGVVAKIARKQSDSGSMMSVALSSKKVQDYLDRLTSILGYCDIFIGCYNSPNNVTVTGNDSQIDTLLSWLEADSIFARKLKTGVAYHSPRMQKVAVQYSVLLDNLKPGLDEYQDCQFISTVKGMQLPASQLCQGEYWVQNLLSPVRFVDAFQILRSTRRIEKRPEKPDLLGATVSDVLEVGPHHVLGGFIREILETGSAPQSITYLSTLARGRPSEETLMKACGEIFCQGYPVRTDVVNTFGDNASAGQTLTDLPSYPFDHDRSYWSEGRISKDFRFRKAPKHDLLGTPSPDWNPFEPKWRNTLRIADSPWMEDHQVSILHECFPECI